ncbi:MAG: AraC family ligand binding domain-containing protein [Prevotella sp.]|nr:AraC family ligand binding domain-containing protein [Prevotella sp.]
MELLDIKPGKGSGAYRLGDSDELVLIENIFSVPTGKICPREHGIIVICTEGNAQLEYDGATIHIQKNDLFLYMSHSTGCKFWASPDYECRQIWFGFSALYSINIYSDTNLSDMSYRLFVEFPFG